MRHATVTGATLVSGVFLFLCLLLVAVYVGITLAGGTDLILPWDW
jgi:hypothetical protein